MDKFAENLRTIRRRKGLTQLELAKISGISNNQLCKYEMGYCSPNTQFLEWLCKALDVSSKELLGF
jgi:transcriptional regulator with XRE-family HTH domain